MNDNHPSSSSRIFRLVRLIREIRSGEPQTPRDLYTRLNISKSQFQRDCRLLRDTGFIFNYDRRSRTYMVDEDPTLPVNDLTLDEIFALVLALQQMAGISSTHIAARAIKAGNKLLRSFRDKGTPSLSHALHIQNDMIGYGRDNKVIHDLNLAIVEQKRLVITYRKPGQQGQDVEIEPYQLYLKDGFLYLDAWSVPRRDIRRFKVCRIRKTRPTGVRFSYFHGYDFKTRQKTAFNVFAGDESEKVCIRFSPKIRPYIEEYNLHESQKKRVLEDGFLEVRLEVAEPREVMWWVMRWGDGAEILEPEWLRDEVRGIVGRMKKVYDEG